MNESSCPEQPRPRNEYANYWQNRVERFGCVIRMTHLNQVIHKIKWSHTQLPLIVRSKRSFRWSNATVARLHWQWSQSESSERLQENVSWLQVDAKLSMFQRIVLCGEHGTPSGGGPKMQRRHCRLWFCGDRYDDLSDGKCSPEDIMCYFTIYFFQSDIKKKRYESIQYNCGITFGKEGVCPEISSRVIITSTSNTHNFYGFNDRPFRGPVGLCNVPTVSVTATKKGPIRIDTLVCVPFFQICLRTSKYIVYIIGKRST